MVSDREKLLMIMSSLEKDYEDGKISEEKYRYFKAKYEERLHFIDVNESRNNKGLMQERSSPPSLNRKNPEELTKKNKQTKQDLVQKYIINPKKGDKDLNKIKRKPMDPSTFKLIAVLVLVIGFTCGIGYGIFNFDYEGLSSVTAEAICKDTAFPEVHEVVNTTNNTTGNTSNSSSYSSSDNDDDVGSYKKDTYSSSSYDSDSFSASHSDSKSDHDSYSKSDGSSNKYHSSEGGSSYSSSNKYSSGGDSDSSSKGSGSGGSGYSSSVKEYN